MTERLTRDELTWLLTQEARSAAARLREGVGSPTVIAEPGLIITEEGSGGVESTLNRLDETVRMLASLQGQTMPRGRRGRIDVAALLWEIAPDARVQIEMGEGTTIIGDEGELRRMLYLLLGQAGDPSASRAEVSVRSQDSRVRIAVHLGPDTSATSQAERRWLTRMAMKYGGELRLEGSTQVLTLPTDTDSSRQEVEDLRRELAAAQAQGEAYARELAAMLRASEGPSTLAPTPISIATPSQLPPNSGGLTALVAAARHLSTNLRGVMAAVGRDLAPLRDRRDEVGDIAASVGRHVSAASEVIADLARLGACPLIELPKVVDLVELVHTVVRDSRPRNERRQIRVDVSAPTPISEVLAARGMETLLHFMLEHAAAASPEGSVVRVDLVTLGNEIHVNVTDRGASVPPAARSSIFSRDFEVLAVGRPTGVALVAAFTIAAELQLYLELDEPDDGSDGLMARLRIPRTDTEHGA